MVKLIAGNWKMNGTAADLGEVESIEATALARADSVEVALCVPLTLLHRAAEAAPDLLVGAQDIHPAAKGAHTGDCSAAMLRDAGARIVIVGHSERREAHGEQDAAVKAKAEAALAAGLHCILCVGESLFIRETGRAVETVAAQVDGSLPGTCEGLSLAYEPIWAIGTGRVAEPADIEEMHAAIRARLVEAYGAAGRGVRILYGGSVNAGNAAAIFAVPEVGGALVGGASLKAADFAPIVAAAAASEAGAGAGAGDGDTA